MDVRETAKAIATVSDHYADAREDAERSAEYWYQSFLISLLG